MAGVRGCQHRPRENRIALGNGRYQCRKCGQKRRCYHTPVSLHLPLPDGGYRCPVCRTDIQPRTYAPHGTFGGYERHRRAQRRKTPDPEWGWPACEPCDQARRDYHNGRNRTGGDKNRDKTRRNAWAKALRRLKVAYPGDFAKFYAEELTARGIVTGKAKARIRAREDITRVLSEVDERRLLVLVTAIMNVVDDAELAKLVRARVATKREIDQYRQIQQLRYMLRQQ